MNIFNFFKNLRERKELRRIAIRSLIIRYVSTHPHPVKFSDTYEFIEQEFKTGPFNAIAFISEFLKYCKELEAEGVVKITKSVCSLTGGTYTYLELNKEHHEVN